MNRCLILLTDPEPVPDLIRRLRSDDRGLGLKVAHSLGHLEKALAEAPPRVRLMAFCSGVVVPPALLKALPGPAYNLHPGPPEVRGLYPSVHAIYQGLPTFGTTLHEMAEGVDSGPIVAVDRFPMPAPAERWRLDRLSLASALAMVGRLAPQLADIDTPLPHLPDVQWSGPAHRRADFEALCQLPSRIDAAEFDRRYRAVGEGPEHALSIRIFGQRFVLDNQRDPAAASRAGRSRR
ncbi:formyltransferase family protein [Roseospirillum parvum]|uniref:Formyl transferase n=1 Tax=Roseospirillum parvum TaxID=83401 RepID=A0A1G7W8S1_9PROT|nr:formyltransferase family protein [Roseospirillum parvum]SDG68352.1 Formyl transferase [Roseospirillum parvum]